MMKSLLKLVCLLIACLSFSTIQAKVELPAVLADNMVLQRNSEVNLWGKAQPNRTVTVVTS